MAEVFDFLLKNKRTSHSIDETMERLFDVTEEYRNLYIKYSRMGFPASHHITLAYNYALVLVEISEDVENHFQFIKTLPVDDRIDYHKDMTDRMKRELETVRDKAEKIANSEIEIDVNKIISSKNDIPVLQSLKRFAEKAGQPMLEESINLFQFIYMIIDAIIERFETLANLRLTRDDRDYHDLFVAIQDYYFLSDDWERIKNQYINKLFQTKKLSATSTISDVVVFRNELLEDIYNEAVWGEIYDLEEKNFTKLAKYSIQTLAVDSPDKIIELLKLIGKYNLLSDWMKELEDKGAPYDEIPEETPDEIVGFAFTSDEMEQAFNDKFPQIKKYMEGKKAIDWCCVHHILGWRNFINDCDFVDFMRWLNIYNGNLIMTEANIRQVKSDYFVKTKVKWNLDDYRAENDTTQTKSRYKRYINYCDDIEAILKGNYIED